MLLSHDMASLKMKSYSLSQFLIVLLLTLSLLLNSSSCSSSSSSDSEDSKLSAIKSLCQSTPHPDVCFDSMKISVSIGIDTTILDFLLHSLDNALPKAKNLLNLFSSVQSKIVENQKGTLQDCKELQQMTIWCLQESVSILGASSPDSSQLGDAGVYLSAAETNKVTCLECLDSASGSSKSALIKSITNAYKDISNALSLLFEKTGGYGSASSKTNGEMRRRLTAYPSWISTKDRHILQSSTDEYDPSNVLTVAADGTGNFTTLTDAINFAPNNSAHRIFIHVKQGNYPENVEIPSWKTNIILYGDGSDVTVMTGKRSLGDGWTTFRSATVAVSGYGFLARDITFENTAGPEKHQAVALRVNADKAAFYRCTMKGYQDTLYVHSFRQFYRECDIYGTVDYIFGNSAVVFQGCNIISRLPMHGQYITVTAQAKEDPHQFTGISIQNCSILPTIDLDSNSGTVRSFLGRPWKNYSTTVIMDSYIDGHIAPGGWTPWTGENDSSLNTLYYGEFSNYGPGSGTGNRVKWPGFHIMDCEDASSFTVSKFISGDQWLDSIPFPYEDGI